MSPKNLDSEDDYRSGSRKRSHNNSLSKDYPHPDNHAKHITDTPWFKPFTIYANVVNVGAHFLCHYRGSSSTVIIFPLHTFRRI